MRLVQVFSGPRGKMPQGAVSPWIMYLFCSYASPFSYQGYLKFLNSNQKQPQVTKQHWCWGRGKPYSAPQSVLYVPSFLTTSSLCFKIKYVQFLYGWSMCTKWSSHCLQSLSWTRTAQHFAEGTGQGQQLRLSWMAGWLIIGWLQNHFLSFYL